MKRTATTNSLKTLLLINMKTKRIKTTNSGVYLPDECWELVFKNLLMDDQDYNSLSLVSKQFLSITNRLRSTHMFLIGNCFPELQRIDLSHCKDIYADSIYLLLMGCWDNITHLNLTACSIFTEDRTMNNFQVPKLKVLNLSYSSVDDKTLNIITKTCIGILEVSLKHCDAVGYKGVKRLLRNCKQLREINLKHCPRVVDDINVDSIIASCDITGKVVARNKYDFLPFERLIAALSLSIATRPYSC